MAGIKPDFPQTVRNLKTGTLTVRPLKNVKYTGKLMEELAVWYQRDVAEYFHLSLIQFYDFIKNIPYKADPKEHEFLQRPYYTLKQRGKGGDCDDKCICLGSYLAAAGIPFRFVALGNDSGPNARLHHVITEALIEDSKGNKRWIHLDPTYSYNTIGAQLRNYGKRLEITEGYPRQSQRYPVTFNGKEI